MTEKSITKSTTKIWYQGLPCRRNHLFQILCWSVKESQICKGSNFAIWLSRSPLAA